MLAKIKLYIKKIRSFFLTKKINKNITRYKYVHVMDNNKFNKPFVDFINKNFNPDEHMVLCYKKHPNRTPTLFPRGNNVYEYIYFKDIKGLLGDNIDKIIFHSLFPPGVVDGLYREPELLKKSYWVIWGGDLYNAPRDEKNDFVRKNFKGYISAVKGDEEIAQKKYNSDAVLMNARYICPVNFDYIKKLKHNKSDSIVVQINNSCDKSTLEMLDILSKFKDKNIKVRTILSYGKMQYKNEIIKKGKWIFGNNFSYLSKLISPSKYIKYLAQNDILILASKRQQGSGNAAMVLYYGEKVYIPENVITFKYFENLGCKTYKTEEIENSTFEEFISYPDEIRMNNIQQLEKYYGDTEYCEQQKMWNNVFSSKD